MINASSRSNRLEIFASNCSIWMLGSGDDVVGAAGGIASVKKNRPSLECSLVAVASPISLWLLRRWLEAFALDSANVDRQTDAIAARQELDALYRRNSDVAGEAGGDGGVDRCDPFQERGEGVGECLSIRVMKVNCQ